MSRHFETSRTKLYCGMGVSGSPRALRDVIDIVRDLDLHALIVTTRILDDVLKSASDHVLLLPHVPAHRANPLADIALTHGGAGTVQTAIHAGTPLVGIPMQLEQAGNISLVARQSAGIMLSRPDLTRKRLGAAMARLVSEPDFKENMQRLKKLQDSIDGATVAANELMGFLQGRG